MTGLRRQVPGMRRTEIALRADLLRKQIALLWGACPDAFPIVDYIERVLQVALPDFTLEIVEDTEMRGIEGATWPDQLHMRLGNSVYEGAVAGERRARFTVAHELGHLFLHRGLPFARAIEDGHKLNAYECSEWQAHEFAGALLMPERLIQTCGTVLEVMQRCEVSEQAAQTRLAKLKIKRPHG